MFTHSNPEITVSQAPDKPATTPLTRDVPWLNSQRTRWAGAGVGQQYGFDGRGGALTGKT
ncbi:MAG: hypothetical protein IPG51_19200 [Chloroflexi bacterium]|nr:hypothetical protein [Chloroflexota bacterium]